MKKNHSKTFYALICIVFVLSLITIAMSISYAFYKSRVKGETTQTQVNSATFNIETSLNTMATLDINDMVLLNSNEIEEKAPKMDFTIKSTATTKNAGKFNVYLKDIAITNNLIDQYFKWELLMDGEVIKTGSFNDIETKGVKSTSKSDTSDTKYFNNYYLATNIDFNGFAQSDITIRIYLLNEPTVNQNNLMYGAFECRIAVEGYSTK